jgi:hypothetical protein
MYLESSSLANNKYYARYGFEVQKDIFLERGRTPVKLSIMVREPGAGRKGAAAHSTRAVGRFGMGMHGMGRKGMGLGLGLFHGVGGGNGKVG